MEDTAPPAEASNAVLHALHEAAALAEPAAAVRAVLEHARRALRAERAFLVEEADPPRVLAIASVRGEEGSPSKTVARRLLQGTARAQVALGSAPTDPESVRALDLRAVLGAPLPGAGGRRRALVLDSRTLPEPVPASLAERLEGFAALLALAARRLPSAAGAEGGWTGTGPAFRALLERIRAVAASRLPVLISGESGTGKDGVARRIHGSGPSPGGPFVAVNCAAVPEALLEGELFGTVRGAYTGADRDRAGLVAAADGGTLFLDEVGDMPLPMQAKLLRVLQEGRVRPVGSAAERTVHVRVLAATHRDLRRACAARTFRPDLLYRLAVLEIEVPPLRKRLDDLPALVPFLLDRLAAQAAVPSCTPSPAVLRLLAGHRWPGNVRELESVLARAAVRAGGGTLLPEHLHLPSVAEEAAPEVPGAPGEPWERAMVRAALVAAEGSIAGAASRIGWTRQKLYRRLLALGLQPSGSEEGTMSSASSTFQ